VPNQLNPNLLDLINPEISIQIHLEPASKSEPLRPNPSENQCQNQSQNQQLNEPKNPYPNQSKVSIQIKLKVGIQINPIQTPWT